MRIIRSFRFILYGIGIACAIGSLVISCSTPAENARETLFEQIPSSKSNVSFINKLTSDSTFNIYTYANFYSGGGVGLGDFNKDGFLDIYLSANQNKNKLYLNRGNFTFRDITQKAGVGGAKAWSTGVSVADINGDGWLDIYVCNAGEIEGDDKKNELFINNGDSTFTERAEEYGLADSGLSTHASFFDYDNDGDLDMYLLNYTSRSIGSFNLQNNLRNRKNFKGGDRFYRNDLIRSTSSSDTAQRYNKSPIFTDVTEETGIYSSEIGFGLGVSVADVNRDGWQDIFISNDFFERDYFYLNNRDGSFREVLEQQMNAISTASMGGDIADLNHDGLPEIFVTDMLPEKEKRLKTTTFFADWERYQYELWNGYYHQFTRNVLQYNNGNGTFSEIGRYAGVEATDWSWGALIADFDMDGNRDIFVPNGIYKDVTDQDHLRHVSSRDVRSKVIQNKQVDYEKLINMMPSTPLSNYLFTSDGHLQFTDRAEEWGLAQPGFSNGSAYGDLDNDGDQDLVVNNVNMEAFIYRNRSRETYPERNWLQLKLQGKEPNTSATGAQVSVVAGDKRWHAEQMPIRGFQSTVDQRLYFGLGQVDKIDTLWVHWPDGKLTRKLDIKPDQLMTIKQSHARADSSRKEAWRQQSLPANTSTTPVLEEVTQTTWPGWHHKGNGYVDFIDQPLLFQSRSNEGPPVCTGDLNADSREDFFIGGAKGRPGAIFLQTASGSFKPTNQQLLQVSANSEDTDCAFFDANGDGAVDIYAASGGTKFAPGDAALADRLYLNDGKGQFSEANHPFSAIDDFNKPTGVVAPADYDKDGDIDLFVGIRMQLAAYGVPAEGYLLENEGTGNFRDVTGQHFPEMSEAGLITDAAWGDIDNDHDTDLLLTGEWMPITLFRNEGGNFVAGTREAGLDSTSGWWNTLELADLDGDGDLDWIGGNHGLNSRFRASPQKPVELWVSDFERNGEIEQIFTAYNGKQSYPVAQRNDLVKQLPMLAPRVKNYHAYAQQTVRDLFDEEQLRESIHLQAAMLTSSIGWNDGSGHYNVEPLPVKAQWSPVYTILAQDLYGNNRPELLLGGNLHHVKPQAGPYDAGFGIMLTQDSSGHYQALSPRESGFFVEGEIRAVQSIEYNGQVFILVGRNDEQLQVFKARERQ